MHAKVTLIGPRNSFQENIFTTSFGNDFGANMNEDPWAIFDMVTARNSHATFHGNFFHLYTLFRWISVARRLGQKTIKGPGFLHRINFICTL
jgi:hypothetical protein